MSYEHKNELAKIENDLENAMKLAPFLDLENDNLSKKVQKISTENEIVTSRQKN